MYRINGNSVESYGITPIQSRGSALAVMGELDYPARKGATEHSWGTETEAFVEAADLQFEGRELIFNGIIKNTSRASLLSSLSLFHDQCIVENAILQTHIGTYNVTLAGGIDIEELTDKTAIITANFYQPVVAFDTPKGIASGGSGYLIDGYSFLKDFGITVSRNLGRLNTPPRIEIGTTAFYQKTAYREPAEIRLTCTVSASDLTDLKTKIGRLQTILSRPGLRTLTFPDGDTASVYNANGFRVDVTHAGAVAMAKLNLTLRKQ